MIFVYKSKVGKKGKSLLKQFFDFIVSSEKIRYKYYMDNEKILTFSDQQKFRDWLGLNLASISWEGRYLDDFNRVWAMIFKPETLVSEQFSIIQSLSKYLSQGPVISWFKWLQRKLIVYLFIYEDFSVRELSDKALLKQAEVAIILRDFFVNKFSYLEEHINEKFQLNHFKTLNSTIYYSDLTFITQLDSSITGSNDEEVLKDLEVTLYSDWQKLKYSLEQKKSDSKANQILKNKKRMSRRLVFIRELVLLFLVGGLLIFAIKIGNKAYENYLVKKISLFSPQFFWLDKNLSFKGDNFLKGKEMDIKLDELEKLEKLESKKVFDDLAMASRFEVESDVVLTSVDSLPKDFQAADLEQSNYEEIKKGGYRNNRYGRGRAYRVMMTSVNPNQTKDELVRILKNYGVEQADNVLPGTKIPGGIYFNLYVPQNALKEFLSKVSTFEDEATILESKTTFGGRKDMNKVFIWIKSI